jgi:hypothetical protein
MKIYLAICVVVGILLGWWFVVDCQRYDLRRHGDNDDYPTWTAADWHGGKELHWDKPEEER